MFIKYFQFIVCDLKKRQILQKLVQHFRRVYHSVVVYDFSFVGIARQQSEIARVK